MDCRRVDRSRPVYREDPVADDVKNIVDHLERDSHIETIALRFLNLSGVAPAR